MISRALNRIAKLRKRNKWEWLIALRLNNRKVNSLLSHIDLQAVGAAGFETGFVDISAGEYSNFVAADSIRSLKALPYFHSKVIEYLVTTKVLELCPTTKLLDAAGGSTAEYLRAVQQHIGGIDGIIQDPYCNPELAERYTVITGSIDSIPLEDDTVDAISCHHSIEHFRDNLDTRFVLEAVRVLKPGGKLAIVPIFLANHYAQVWNQEIGQFPDPKAIQIVDRSATFAGWGPFEGFARTYDLPSFQNRIVNPLKSNCRFKILQVRLDGNSVPDLKTNRHQPKLNYAMKVLVITKLEHREGICLTNTDIGS